MKKCYSLYEEDSYTDDEYNCIVEYYDNSTEVDFPFELKIYEGDEVQFKPSHFLPYIADNIVDNIVDNMADEVGKWGDSWLENLTKKTVKLQSDFELFFDKWCEENDCKVKFYNVDNIKKVTYTVTSFDDYEVKK